MDSKWSIVKEIGRTPEEQVLLTNILLGEGAFSKVVSRKKRESYQNMCKDSIGLQSYTASIQINPNRINYHDEYSIIICLKITIVSLDHKQCKLLNKTFSKFKFIKCNRLIELKELLLIQNYIFVHDSEIYFMLEYCEDGDLTTLLTKNVLNEGQVLYLFGQLSRGMLDLKKQNVFHRDLKPNNILLKDGCIKIADFGLSKICDPLHISNTQVGTPYYMSPQALTSKNYSLERNDIWSAGVMLYQMLYRRYPWQIQDHETHQRLIEMIRTTNIHFATNPPVSEETKDLIKNMLEIEEDARIEWEEIMNMNIIRESQKENYKQDIIQMIKKNQK